jgi:hypothetical protein
MAVSMARSAARGTFRFARPSIGEPRGKREPSRTMTSDEERLQTELVALAERQRSLDLRLAEALSRLKHLKDADETARAVAEERRLLAELDRLMTRTRAVEGQLLQIRKGRPPTPA